MGAQNIARHRGHPFGATLDGDLACLPQNWREKWQKWLQKHQLNPDLGQSWGYFFFFAIATTMAITCHNLHTLGYDPLNCGEI